MKVLGPSPERKDRAEGKVAAAPVAYCLTFYGVLLVSEAESHIHDTLIVIQRARARVDWVSVFIVENHILEVEGHPCVLVGGGGLAVFAGAA